MSFKLCVNASMAQPLRRRACIRGLHINDAFGQFVATTTALSLEYWAYKYYEFFIS